LILLQAIVANGRVPQRLPCFLAPQTAITAITQRPSLPLIGQQFLQRAVENSICRLEWLGVLALAGVGWAAWRNPVGVAVVSIGLSRGVGDWVGN
jgi:hypothetical protein